MKRSAQGDDGDFKTTKKFRKNRAALKNAEANSCQNPSSIFNGAPKVSSSVTASCQLDLKLKRGTDQEDDGRCPVCCFPFKHLVGITRHWHVMECLDHKFDEPGSFCSDGLQCDVIHVNHYKTFQHHATSKGNVKGIDHQSDRKKTAEADSSIWRETVKTSNEEHVDKNEQAFLWDESDEIAKQQHVKKCSVSPVLKSSIDSDSPDGQHFNRTTSLTLDNTSRLISLEDDAEWIATDCSSSLLHDSESLPHDIDRVSSSSCIPKNQGVHLPDSSNLTSTATKRTLLMHKSKSCSSLGGGENTNKNKLPNKLIQTDIGVFFGSKKLKPIKQGSVKEEGEHHQGKTLSPSQWRWNSQKKSLSKTKADLVATVTNETESKQGNKNVTKYCPFYKKIPDSPFTVDAFRYGQIPGCLCYFLTHFHYDHYGGLTKNFKGKVYCSKVTANLVISQLKVPANNVIPMPMDTEVVVHGVTVTLLDANHCPGSVLFLFEFTDGRRILHTGDFRACKEMSNYTKIREKSVDILYLDTTYCLPYYKFPTQQDTIDFAINKALAQVKREPKSLIVSGTYTIGKERVFYVEDLANFIDYRLLADCLYSNLCTSVELISGYSIAKALDSKICVRKDKMRVLSCLEWDDLSRRLTLNPKEAQVHVLPMNSLSLKFLQGYLESQTHVKEIIAFKPTGWTYTDKNVSLEDIKPFRRPGVSVYGIPYSEHSSYTELQWFVRFLKPSKIIPTVNVGSAEKREEMQNAFKEWLR